MTVMVSFRIDELDAAEIDRWSDRLGIERSELIREALSGHLARLQAEVDADAYVVTPFDAADAALDEADDWGPAEDWDDWAEWIDRQDRAAR